MPDLSQMTVDACDSNSADDCSVCNSFIDDFQISGWIEFLCPEGGIEASEVKIHFSAERVRFTKVEIWGKSLVFV